MIKKTNGSGINFGVDEKMKGNIVIGMFMLVVVLIIFANLLPTINDNISNILPNLSSFGQTLIVLIPTAIVIVMLTAVIKNRMTDELMQVIT